MKRQNYYFQGRNSKTGKLSKYFYFWKSRNKCLFCQIDLSISFSSVVVFDLYSEPIVIAFDLLKTFEMFTFRVFCCELQKKWVVDIIDMEIQGVSGVPFGGPSMDILFVTMTADILSLTTGAVLNIVKTGSSLYKITGLGVTGPKPTGFIIDQENWNDFILKYFQ